MAPRKPEQGNTAAPVAPAEPKPEAPTISDSERAVLLELRQRRQELDARETALATRESVLGAAERKVAARVEELQALQNQLQNLDASRHEHDEAGWQGLVKLYENMKPRDAATIMNELDMPVLLQVLDRMKEAKAAPILSAMKPDKAREVTDGLAKLRVRTATNVAPGG
jgi:flagellar motility protein MotE (MotC chaperone)